MKQHWKINTLIVVLIGLIFYMVNISWSQAYYSPQPPSGPAEKQSSLDSLRALRAYRTSQHYKDSIANWRIQRRDSMIAVRQHAQDSMRAVRQKTQDSMKAVRLKLIAENRRIQDSARNARQLEQELRKAALEKRKDSLNAIRAYRSSQHFKDSIAAIRQQRRDSIIAVRKHTQDSLRAIQTAFRDSMIVERNKANEALRASIDSMRTRRQMIMDSLATVRQERRDSLATIRGEREAARKLREEEKEEKRKLKLALEIQQKQDAYTNEDLRKKKWGFPRSIFQNLFTRYNYWFNTNEKLKEIERNIQRIHKDDLEEFIPLFVVDPVKYESQLASEMDSLVQRASVGIQIHDPRSKWQDDLYMIVGKAYYYKGDYENAQSAFRYVIAIGDEIKENYLKKNPKWKHDPAQFSMPPMKKSHVPARNQAIIWLAKAMAADQEYNKAIGLLQMVQHESQFPEKLKGDLHLELANTFLKLGQTDRALESLLAASEHKNIDQQQKIRVHFLLGQIFQEKSELVAANKFYKKLEKGNVPLDLDFHAKHQLLWNQFIMNESPEKAQEELAKLSKEGKFHDYSAMALLSLGKTYALQENYTQAIKTLEKSVESANDPAVLSEGHMLLGDYNYLSLNYTNALTAYEKALTTLDPESQNDNYVRATNRTSALTELVPHYAGLYQADSLKALMILPEEDQRKHIQAHLKDLKQAIKDSINTSVQQSALNPALALNQRGGQRVTSSFYFDNAQLVQQGLQEFKQQWGDRPLQDGWRRKAQRTGGSETTGDDLELVLAEDEDGLPTEAYLLAQIPSTDEEQEKVIKAIESYLFLLAKSYYIQVEDYPLAYQNFDRLVKEYPESIHLPEAYYYLYLISNNNTNLGDKHQILKQMKNSIGEDHRLVIQIEESLQRKEQSAISTQQDDYELYYEQLYDLSQNNQYPVLLDEIEEYRQRGVSFQQYEAHVALLEIIGQIGVRNIDDAQINLELFFIERTQHPQLIEIAEKIKEMLENETEWDSQNLIQSIQESYTHDPLSPFEVIIKLGNTPQSMVLKSAISDYNLMSTNFGLHSVSIQSLTNEDNIILISDFENLQEAKSYINTLRKQKVLFEHLDNLPYTIRMITKENLQRLLYTKDWQEYEQFYIQQVNR